MNPMALLFALLASAGAASALAGGRRRNVDRDEDDRAIVDGNVDGDDRSGTGDGGGTDGGSAWAPGEAPSITLPTPPVQTGGTGEDGGSVASTPLIGETISAMTGRVTTLSPQDASVASVRIVDLPEHGQVSVNPDNTLALVMTGSQYTGPMSFSYEVTHEDGSTALHQANLNVTPGLHDAGWGTGESHYMLETDENDRVVVEHGDAHRKVFLSGSADALTLEDIARLEGISASSINGNWLAANPEYGGSEAMALAEEAGNLLWGTVSGRWTESSNWLLLERGYEYNNLEMVHLAARGESELHPLYIGAWGDGAKPVITNQLNSVHDGNENIVIQDLHFTEGMRWLHPDNVIVDNVTFTNRGFNFQLASGITLRNSEFFDIVREEPANTGTTWDAAANRMTAIYAGTSNGVLLEGNFVDHVGWANDYKEDLSIEGGHPPSMFSHGIYVQKSSTDVTLRDSIIMRSASTGVQMRPGGFIEDNVFLDNNIGLNFYGGSGDDEKYGNYTLFTDNVVTSAGYKRVDVAEGAFAMGVDNGAYLSSLVDNVIAHLADPNNPAELTTKLGAHPSLANGHEPFYDDTIIWNWMGATSSRGVIAEQNAEGLDTNVLDQTTIQLFAAQLLSKPDATIADLANYLRAQTAGELDDVVDSDLIIQFFQSGFGIQADIRAEAGMLRFIPDELGDGVRWDNRLNWSTEDLPGFVAGDSVDLGGNKVVFGGTAKISELEFGPNGGLKLDHGKLTVAGGMETSPEGATLDVNGAGQIWTEGGRGTGTLDIDVTGGRFANTGNFRMNSDLTASGGQTLLGVDGATYAVTDGSRLEVEGAGGKVGFDGAQNGISILGIDDRGTLAFTAKDGELGTIEEFRSGALGDTTKVLSGADLGGGKLEIDLTELVDSQGTFTLLDVDELIGAFGSANVTGLGGRNAEIVVDYQNDSVSVVLNAGSGDVTVSSVGAESTFNTGEAALWEALTAGKGKYGDEMPAQDEEDYLFAA